MAPTTEMYRPIVLEAGRCQQGWLFLSTVGGNLPQDSPQAIGRLWVNFDNPWSVDESPICHHFHMASPCVYICLCVQISLF